MPGLKPGMTHCGVAGAVETPARFWLTSAPMALTHPIGLSEPEPPPPAARRRKATGASRR